MKQSMSHDDLGDRMKMYEGAEAARRFMPRIPIVARMDGRAFHTFTRGMKRPYDNDLTECMIATTQMLVDKTNASIGYCQSDEITLIWSGISDMEAFWFGGRVQKMCSMLASMTTMEFNIQVRRRMAAHYADRAPLFDARVWQVPNETEATNVLVWRENDAVKNSIMAMALACVGHTKVLNQNQRAQLDLIHGSGANWNTEPNRFKRGTYVRRTIVSTPFTAAEIESLPAKHHARTNPDLMVERARVEILHMPRITTVMNRNDVIFHGAVPETLTGNHEAA